MPVSDLTIGMPDYRGYSNVQPFTARDGATYLMQMEALKEWWRDIVVPHIDKEIGELVETWDGTTTELITKFNAITLQLITEATELAGQSASSATAAEASRIAAEAAAALAEQWANQAEEAQDGAVTKLFMNPGSDFRIATDAVYASIQRVAVLEALVTDGRLSEAELNELFAGKADAAAFDTLAAIINNGRLSEVTINNRFSAIINDGLGSSSTSTYSSTKILSLLNGKTIWGNISARPAPNTVPTGTTFYSLDVPEVYLNTGGVWTVIGAGGNELGYAEHILPMANAANTTAVPVPGLTVTFIAGQRPIMVELACRLANAGAGSISVASVRLDGVEVARIELNNTSAETWESLSVSRRLPLLTPGTTHTVDVAVKLGTGVTGTARMAGDATNPNSLSVRTV